MQSGRWRLRRPSACDTSSCRPSSISTLVSPQHGSFKVACVRDYQESMAQIEKSHADQNERLPRFYVPEIQSGASRLVVEGEEARHLAKALRLKVGDAAELCDGRGTTVACAITTLDARGSYAWLEPISAPVVTSWTGPRWTVAVACTTLKGGRAEWLIEKCTEVGAYALIPLLTDRSQAGQKNKFKTSAKSKKESKSNDDASEDYQPGRLERVSIAATKQSLRTHALLLHPPTHLDDVLDLVSTSQPALVAVGGAPPLQRVLSQFGERHDTTSSLPPSSDQDDVIPDSRQHDQDSQRKAAKAAPGDPAGGMLIIGPEGDFTVDELSRLMKAGAVPVGLGRNRLRTETAAIAMLSALMLMESDA